MPTMGSRQCFTGRQGVLYNYEKSYLDQDLKIFILTIF